MKLEVGMYVRFKDKRGNTYIRKIIDIPKDNRYASIYIDKEANYTNNLSFKNVLKASHNIIDLIEEHDILLLFDKEYGENYKAEVVLDGSNFKVVVNYEQCVLLNLEYELITEEHIKLLSILTKEQFSQMEYRLGDK